MFVIKPLQNRTEDGMFGHPTWNAFALMSPNSRFLNNHTCSRVVTRNGPLPQILKDMGITMEVTRLSHRHIDKNSINPSQCAYNPNDEGISPSVARLSNLKNTRK